MSHARRTTLASLAAVITVVVLSPRSTLPLSAAARPGSHLEQYGEVVVRDLPRAVPQRGGGRAVPFRPTNADDFARHKASRTAAAVPAASASPGSALVSITDAGFDGVTFAEAGALPPDTQIAVGPNHVFEVVNDWVRIWSRQTSPPSVAYDVDLGTFFGVGFFTTLTDVISDPRVVYDASTGRWFVSCVTLETLLNTAEWRLAVSTTSDPTGTYKLYASTFTGNFPDFPSLGVSDDKLALTGNAFTISAEQFVGSEFLVANKADLLAGVSSPRDTFFGPPQAVDAIQAAVSLSSTSALYLAAVASGGQTSTLQLWAITGVPGVGSGLAVTTKALAQQATLVIPPDAVQPNSAIALATNDVRLLNLVYRNGELWMGSNAACTPAGDAAVRACLHFVQVDAASQTVAQEITFGEAGAYFYYPAVSIDAAGNMIAVFNRSSASEFASVYTSGHNASDAAGSFQTPTLVRSGLGPYDPSPYPPRWGDYSGAAADPFDAGASIWVAGEYARADDPSNWGTWLATVSSGSTCALPATPTGLVATPGDAQVALAWTASTAAASYTVKRASISGGPYTPIAGVSSTAFTDTGLTNGTTYFYVVSATNGCGESADSVEVSGTPVAVQAPASPTRLGATAAKRKIMLNWTQSTSAGVTQNRIYRSTTNGGGYAAIATIAAATSYTDTQVTSGTIYYYVVTAIGAGGESQPSNQASAKAK